jgi:tetratricopeptide (TPR) repeat protein
VKAKTPVKEHNIYRYSPLIILVVTMALYLPALRLGFVYFDDDILILSNYDKISNLANIGKAFRSDAFFANLSPYYRPLQTVSFMPEAMIGGRSPAIYHLGNILYHVMTCLSLLWLLGLLGFSRQKALAATLVFTVHPVMGQAVLWIPARGDLLVTMFAIISFGLFVRFLRERKPHLLILHSLCIAGAVFSKESGVFLPPLFLLYLVLKREKLISSKTIALAGSWITVLTVWYFLRYISIDHRSDGQLGLHAMVKNLAFLPEAVSRFFFPFDLPVTPVFTSGYTLGGIVAILAIVVYAFIKGNRSYLPLVFFGAVWFAGFCLPNMFVRLSSADDHFEYLLHRTYLPSAGLIIMLLGLFPDKWFDIAVRPVRIILPSILVLLAIFSFTQQSKYANAQSYWGSAIEYQPGKSWFYYFMGRYYFKQKDNDTYEQYLLKAESIKSYGEFKYQLGMIYFSDRKSYDTAYNYFSAAFRQGYADPKGREYFIALCLEASAYYYSKGDFKKAIKLCGEALVNDPGNADAAYNLGIYLINDGEKQKAASMWLQAIRLNPELTRAYRSLVLYYRYDAKKADSANWYAREYRKYGGTEDLISPD